MGTAWQVLYTHIIVSKNDKYIFISFFNLQPQFLKTNNLPRKNVITKQHKNITT